jgi:hypothetical protein
MTHIALRHRNLRPPRETSRRSGVRRVATVAAVPLALGAALLAPAVPAYAQSAPLSRVVSENPVDYTPHVLNGKVQAIAPVGSSMVVGGQFTTIRDSGSSLQISQPNLFAFDAATGRIVKTFHPTVDGIVETAVAGPTAGTVIIGGSFTKVNGVSHRGLAMLRVSDGSLVTSFTATTNGTVYKALVRGSRLIVGGEFSTIAGAGRERLAVLDASTGKIDSAFDVPVAGNRKPDVQPKTLVFEMDATSDGHYLVILGNFLTVGGASHNQVAIVDLFTNRVTPWASSRTAAACSKTVAFFFTDVEIAPTNDWFALSARGAYSRGQLCDTASRWRLSPTTTSAAPVWVNYTGGDSLWSIAVTPAAVYVGGHQRWLDNPDCNNCAGPGAVSREGIAAIDPGSGKAMSWNPGRSRGVGVQELVATSRGLYEGCDTDRLGGEYHARIGMFPAA